MYTASLTSAQLGQTDSIPVCFFQRSQTRTRTRDARTRETTAATTGMMKGWRGGGGREGEGGWETSVYVVVVVVVGGRGPAGEIMTLIQ